MSRFSFSKNERLKGEKSFALLFAKGKSFHADLFRLTWMYIPAPENSAGSIQAAFVAPKRNFKKAVQRNVIRRRMKEAYRLNKHILPVVCKPNSLLIFVCLYTAKRESTYAEIESKIIVTLQRLVKEAGAASAPLANHDETAQ
jgi:ribonuclease P protein component